ncbi:flavin reductase family protein, partial [Archaeoglobales archaeon]
PISFSPPPYGFACNPEHDTWVNVKKTGEFVVNIAGKNLGEYMHILETDFPYGVNELEKAGLNKMPAKTVKPPRVKEALAWIECRFESYHKIGDNIWVVGKVSEVEVKDEFWKDVVDVGNVLCHIGGEFFAQNMELDKYKRVR